MRKTLARGLKVLVYLNTTRNYGLTFSSGETVLSTSRTKHCVTLPTTEAEHVAMAEGAKECMLVRSILSFLRPRVVLGRQMEYDIVLHEDNEGAKALADNPLSSGRSKHIDVRWHFIRDLVRTGAVWIVHVDPEWQHADIITKPL
ncbi:unnamed protein product, partial [Sphacelaria rigidula]